ncbi:S-layer homology domain-containing protein [Demequina sp. SYSU T00039]|uniref:S-layer homology domain-containing protein n=1 Tax=Demequina lignilytica TaxID=3051663 RepID=A0AAW7M286_9MICO|nr:MULTISPECIES: D-alanyl-D-alanine carboxypeptidase family protein [unclassified Demequina]MDN4478448.1 S-layer homology domain-containing protein [Demequina sp. SYSU T00039-1]MDN4487045.1 S-layer homology domain-containing protein [Demequina sp. SYSU T00039]
MTRMRHATAGADQEGSSANVKPAQPQWRWVRAWARTLTVLAASCALLIGTLPSGAEASDGPLDPDAAASASPAAEPQASSTPAPSASTEPDMGLTSTPEPAATASPTPSPEPSASASPDPTEAPTEDAPAEQVEPEPEPADDSPLVGVLSATSAVFTDVSAIQGATTYSQFATEIAWMAETGISTGWVTADGSAQYRPTEPVSRDAMAAFLNRFAGSPAFAQPSVSPFVDVPTSRQFYREITWLRSAGVSTGWTTATGVEYRPTKSITRDAMAAFLYRLAGSPDFTFPTTSPFVDVTASTPFAKEIAWLASAGVTTGWSTSSGAQYRPLASITRDAMAAYLYRLDAAGIIDLSAALGTTLRHTTVYVYVATTLNLRTGPATTFDVARQVAEGTALVPTGTTQDGWIQVTVDGELLWASSYYLVGRQGAAVTRITSLYENGRLPEEELCTLSWDAVESLECDAAFDLEMLNIEFRNQFGFDLPLNDSYRDYDTQVLFKAVYGDLAAKPGTSNHGWGMAIDVSTSRLPGGTGGAAYAWLTQHVGVYNWVLPAWARPTGTKPEAWHFEYTG